MNIFYLDDVPYMSAAYHVDKHVVKMPIEAMQIVSTALVPSPYYCELYRSTRMYRPTHLHHPLIVWADKNGPRIAAVLQYGIAVAKEYTVRYGREHATRPLMETLLEKLAVFTDTKPSYEDMPLCMPDEFTVGTDRVLSYRNYYNLGKIHLHKWTKRDKPHWIDV